MCSWVAAYALCLMVQLRTDAGTGEEVTTMREQLAPVLRPAELEEVSGRRRPPLGLRRGLGLGLRDLHG